jgi:hypothetical protein
VAHLTSQASKRRLLLHLVNYSAETASIKAIAVTCRLPEGTEMKQLTLYSPDRQAQQTMNAGGGKSVVKFTVPAVRVYSVAALSY